MSSVLFEINVTTESLLLKIARNTTNRSIWANATTATTVSTMISIKTENMTKTISMESKHVETDSTMEATSAISTQYLNTSIFTETKKILQAATQQEGISLKIRKGIKDDSVFHIFRVLIPLLVLGIMLMYILALIWYYRHRIVNVDNVDKKSQGSVCSRNSDDDNLRMRYKAMEAKDESLRTLTIKENVISLS